MDEVEKRRAYDREWKRQYKLKHPELVKQKRRERYLREKNDPEMVEKRKAYQREYQKKWRRENRNNYRKRHREWMKEWNRKNYKEIYAKRRKRPYEKLSASMRTRIRGVLKLGYKSASTEEMLGCTTKDLQKHLESKFTKGMTWGNYGFRGWHVDHIIPLSSFDLSKEKQRKKAFHYTNLQPLWAKDNLKKHAKMV